MTQQSGFLIDLDGTLYHGEHPIAGASELIGFLHDNGIPYQFVTNNSSATAEAVAQRLQNMNIAASPEQVSTSANAAAAYIAGLKPNASVHVIGESGLLHAIEEAGLTLSDDNADFVVQGIDRQLTYDKIAKAAHFIREGAASILTNPDLLLPSSNGLIPGAGTIGRMLEAASGSKAFVIGKPSKVLMDYAINRLSKPCKDIYVIGDNLATDIAAGVQAGCETILVLTGLTTKENYTHYAELAGCTPRYIYNDLFELRDFIEALQQEHIS